MSGAGALKDEQVWVAWWCCHGGDSDVAFGCVPAQLCAQSLCDQAGQLDFWLLM